MMPRKPPPNPPPLEPGTRFARLVVLEHSGFRGPRRVYRCVCDCGEVVEVAGRHLKSGNTKSCGCWHREHMRAVGLTGVANRTHGMRGHPLYATWAGLRQRCNNPTNPNYAGWGGRGIKVCARWDGPDGFPNFVADMGEKPGPEYSLDRSNNDGPYSPSNCRWATPKEQRANRTRRYAERDTGQFALVMP
jgi:hypothetical protein